MGTGNGKGEAKKRESGGEVLIPGKEGSRGTAPPARCKSLLGKDCAQGRLNLSSERPGQEQRQGWGRGQGRGTGPYVRHRASPSYGTPPSRGPGENLCHWMRSPTHISQRAWAPHLCHQRDRGIPPVSRVGNVSASISVLLPCPCLCPTLSQAAPHPLCPCLHHQGHMGEQRLRCGSAALAPLTTSSLPQFPCSKGG